MRDLGKGAMLRDMKQRPSQSSLEQAAGRYLQDHRGRAAIRPAPRAGRAAERILRPLAKKFGVGVDQLTQYWPEIVGQRLAQWSSPKSIQRNGGVSTLIVEARGPAAAVLQAESRRILERVSTYAGSRSPTRLRIVQGRMRAATTTENNVKTGQASSQNSEKVETSAEARLLSALKRFDKSVKSRGGN